MCPHFLNYVFLCFSREMTGSLQLDLNCDCGSRSRGAPSDPGSCYNQEKQVLVSQGFKKIKE